MTDIEKIKAEIERRKEYALEHYQNQGDVQSAYNVCEELLYFIESMEKEPKMDLEKEYDEQFWNDPVYGKLVNRNAGLGIARHFYELGKKDGKENEI